MGGKGREGLKGGAELERRTWRTQLGHHGGELGKDLICFGYDSINNLVMQDYGRTTRLKC